MGDNRINWWLSPRERAEEQVRINDSTFREATYLLFHGKSLRELAVLGDREQHAATVRHAQQCFADRECRYCGEESLVPATHVVFFESASTCAWMCSRHADWYVASLGTSKVLSIAEWEEWRDAQQVLVAVGGVGNG